MRHVETSSDKLGGDGFSKSGKFSINARKWRKIHKNIFSLKGSYRHVQCSFDNPSEKFWTDTRKCPLTDQIDCKYESFSGKFWFLKCSPRPVKLSFDNLVEIYSRKNQLFFARALKLAKKHFQRKPLLKLFQWTVRLHFWQTWRYISVKKLCFFVWKSKSDKRNSTTFFAKKYSTRGSLMDTMNAVLTTQLINTRQNHGGYLLNVRKR